MVDLHSQKLNNRTLGAKGTTPQAKVLKVASVLGLFLILQLASGSIRKEILLTKYQLEDLRRSNAELVTTINLLKAEYNSLTAPQEIERVGKKLGFISANHQGVIILDGQNSVGVRPQLAQAGSSSRVMHE